MQILLHKSTTRLVTIIGPGGIGKTRLALRAAEEAMPAFAHGIWLVDLSELTDPGLVTQVVANALGVGESSGVPLEEQLVQYVRRAQFCWCWITAST